MSIIRSAESEEFRHILAEYIDSGFTKEQAIQQLKREGVIEDQNFTNKEAELDTALAKRKGKFGKTPEWVILRGTPGAIKMYAWLSARYGNMVKGIFPKQETLAAELKVGESTIKNWQADLKEIGALVSHRRGLGLPNTYTLVWDDPQATHVDLSPDR